MLKTLWSSNEVIVKTKIAIQCVVRLDLFSCTPYLLKYLLLQSAVLRHGL